jgi:hypothetical protein
LDRITPLADDNLLEGADAEGDVEGPPSAVVPLVERALARTARARRVGRTSIGDTTATS